MPRIVMRDYQRDTVDVLHNYLHEKDGHPLAVIGTGGGKTLTYNTFADEQIKALPDMRIGLVTHQSELIRQGFGAALNVNPSFDVGIFSASLGQRKTQSQYLFMGIQSVWDKTPIIGGFDILMVDEAHLVPKNADTQYAKFIIEQQERHPWLRVIGFTATPFRTDSGRLDDGDNRLFDEIACDYGIGYLLENGWSTPPITKNTETKLSAAGVTKSGGDFNQKQLAKAVDKDELTKAMVEETLAYADGFKKWLIFATGIQHAENIAAAFRAKGIEIGVVHGEAGTGNNARTLADFKAGKLRGIVNVDMLTTGFDDPEIDLLVMARPTQSTGLYLQIVGRGLRVVWPKGFNPNEATAEERKAAIASGPKPKFRVLDFAGNISRHGPIDEIFVKKKGAKEGSAASMAPTKVCPECNTEVGIPARECPDCGHEWEFNEKPPHEAVASDASILSDKTKKITSDVILQPIRGSHIEVWNKPGKEPTLCVTYHTVQHGSIREWLGFGAKGEFGRKAERWWNKIAPGVDLPLTAHQAYEMLPQSTVEISAIHIQKDGRYWNVRGHKSDESIYQLATTKKCPHCTALLSKTDACTCGGRPTAKENTQWTPPSDWDDIPF